MLIDCPTCQARVDAKVLQVHWSSDQETGASNRTSFLACPACDTPILAAEESWDYDSDLDHGTWSEPRRIYPVGSSLPLFVPEALRRSFTEARTCLHARCYLAAALMCRRTLEALCHHHEASSTNLAGALKKLHDDKVIDDRLFEWAEALRKDGNLAAHDLQANISHRDAADLVHFTQAIVDYVFVLHHRFEAFKQRRATEELKMSQVREEAPTTTK